MHLTAGAAVAAATAKRSSPLAAAAAAAAAWRPRNAANVQLARAAAALVAGTAVRRGPAHMHSLYQHLGLQPRRRHRGSSSGKAVAAATTGAATAATAAACGACGAPSPAVTATTAVTATATAAAASSSWVDIFAVLLGYGCLVGSCFRSVPQIIAILRARSAEGLSLTSNLMELLCYTVTVAYNIQQGYAFNTYGEVFACWIQDVIIVGLIFWYMRLSGPVVAASTAAFGAGCAWLFSSWCPMEVLSALQMSTIVVMAIGARVPQIWLNIRRGDAGVLSPATCVLNVAGCVVRIFTTMVLTRDAIILGGCITQLLLNGVLLYQSIATPGKATTAAATIPPGNPASAAIAVAASDLPVGGAAAALGITQELSAAAADGGLKSRESSTSAEGVGGGGGGDGGGRGGPWPPPPAPTVTPAAA